VTLEGRVIVLSTSSIQSHCRRRTDAEISWSEMLQAVEVDQVESLRGSRSLGDLEGTLHLLEIRCTKCDRYGRERITRLLDRFGREARLPDILTSSRAIVLAAALRFTSGATSTLPTSPHDLAQSDPPATERDLAPQRAVRRLWSGITLLPVDRQAGRWPLPGNRRHAVRASGNLPDARPRGAGAASQRHGGVLDLSGRSGCVPGHAAARPNEPNKRPTLCEIHLRRREAVVE
jgi:hypothetical protein